jgi:hypothetical protein
MLVGTAHPEIILLVVSIFITLIASDLTHYSLRVMIDEIGIVAATGDVPGPQDTGGHDRLGAMER